jgi:hypothetical protein
MTKNNTQNNDGLIEYSYKDAVSKATDYFAGDELAATVWVSKYALKDSFGKIYESSPEQMHNRIATEIARIENNYPNPMSHEEIYDLLKDFKRGKDIIPNESGYVNTFESNHEKLLYSNGTIYDMDISVVPNTYEGKLYQNLYQTLHLLYVCQQEEKCAITFKLSKPVNCSAIKFSFFKNTDSDEKIYDQYITVFTQQNTSFNLPSFTYAKINDIINKGSISEMYLLQTYYFTFPQPDQLITHFILYFEGEILLDDIVLVF